MLPRLSAAAAAAGRAATRRRSTTAAAAAAAYASSDAAADATRAAIAADGAWPLSLSPPSSSSNTNDIYDAIVVGLGAHGSSALYHLARRLAAEAAADGGRRRPRVLGIEAHAVAGHSRASSGGDTRITRQAYFESPLYVPLLRRSARLTRELEGLTQARLFWRTGLLHAGGRLYEGALVSARQHGVAHEALRWGPPGDDETNGRWPGVRLPAGTPVLYEPGAGVLAPERMIRAHAAAAVATGAADVLCGDGAARWGRDGGGGGARGGGVAVETSSGRVFAARRALVLAAGAWMPRLVPELRGWAVPRRYTVAWLEPPAEGGAEAAAASYAYGAFPPFLMEEPGTGVPFYGFPAWPHPGVGGGVGGGGGREGTRRRAVKLGAFAPSSPDLTAGGGDPGASLDRAMRPSDEAEVRRFADACLPGLKGGKLADFAACIFTDTPDSHFLLDAHPRSAGDDGSARVILCSACSGHGFKLSPAVGEALAEMAVGGRGGAGRGGGGRDAIEAALALHRLRPERPGLAEVLERFREG
jgi:sarcosine oxidase